MNRTLKIFLSFFLIFGDCNIGFAQIPFVLYERKRIVADYILEYCELL